MNFRNLYVTNCASVRLLALGLPCALSAAEPDSTQFGFLSGNRPDFSPAAFSSRNDAEASEGAPADGLDSAEKTPAGRRGFFPEWLHLDLTVQSIYDDNIFLAEDHPEADWIARVTPSFRASSGAPDSAVWVVDGTYSPTWMGYAASSNLNSFDQALAAAIRYNGSRLKGATLLSYKEVTGNDRFVRDVISTAISRAELLLNYELTAMTALESRLLWETLDRTDTGDSIYDDVETVSLQISALWQATALTTIGPSLRLGTSASTLSPDRTFVDALVRVDYDSSALLKFSAEGGAQWISFDGDQETLLRPSGSLTGVYAINPLWQLVASAYSRSSPAPSIQNADLQASGVTASLRWQPSASMEFSAGAGYEKARYEFFSDLPERTDDYTFGELRFRTGREGSPMSIEVFYRHRLSDSSVSGQDFQNNQAGVQISRRF